MKNTCFFYIVFQVLKVVLGKIALSNTTLNIGSNNNFKHIASKNKLTKICQRVQNFELTRTSQNNGLVHLSCHDGGRNTVRFFIKATKKSKKCSKIWKMGSNGNKSPS